MKYKCHYIDGGGTVHDAGIWNKVETDKTITFRYEDTLHFTPLYTLIKINKFYSKKKIRNDGNYNAFRDGSNYRGWMSNGNVLREWRDGTYTAYPNQCGTPYIFEPLKQD